MDLIWGAWIVHINWIKALSTHDTDIYDYKYIESFYSDILYFLEGKYLGLSFRNLNISFNEVVFNDFIYLYELWWNCFLLEYRTKILRDDDYSSFVDNYKMNWERSVLLKKAIHFPIVWWYFTFADRFYSIIEWRNRLTKEISDTVFLWVVVNPLKYLQSLKIE